MPMIWRAGATWRLDPFELESDLENAIAEVGAELFGASRVYLPVKKKMGRNVPDAYLIDLAGRKPRLWIVEVETQSHDPYRHVTPQLLQFSMSFKKDPWRLKTVLHDALSERKEAMTACAQYVEQQGFNSVDHLLEMLVRDEFRALVIIDEIEPDLEVMLNDGLKFTVEVVTVQRFRNNGGDRTYLLDEFMQGIREDLKPLPTSTRVALNVSDIDTIVVPAQEGGFQETFIGEEAWYSIRIHASMVPQIKYIAAYRVAPVSAITHLAEVKNIVPSEVPGKLRLNFLGPAHEIRPITLVPHGRVKALQNIRYTNRERLLEAKTLDDVWAAE